MLDADTDGEGLLLHGDPQVVEHGKGVTGGVAGGQDEGLAGEFIGALRAFHGEAAHLAAPDPDAVQPVFEADVTAQGLELQTDGLDHRPEHVGAHVGLVGVAHVLWGAVLHQHVQDGGQPGVVGAGGELAVGEGAGSALAELDVGAGVQAAGGPETLHVGGAGIYIPAPLQHDGGNARPGQEEGGEEPGRAHAHHHRHGIGFARGGGKHIGLGDVEGHVPVIDPSDQGGLVSGVHVHGVDVVDVLLFPGVDGLAHRRQGPDGVGADTQALGGLLPQVGKVPFDGQGQVGNSYHVRITWHRVYHKTEKISTLFQKNDSKTGRHSCWSAVPFSRFQFFNLYLSKKSPATASHPPL